MLAKEKLNFTFQNTERSQAIKRIITLMKKYLANESI